MLKHGILGLISNGDKTGYEIMLVFRDSLSHFWTAQTSQIYRELQTMEKAGWISQTHVQQTDRPDKNVFSITQAGRDELRRWLREDNLAVSLKNPIMMKAFFMGELSPDEGISFFKALLDTPVFPDGGRSASANADMYKLAVDNPEKAIWWKFTIEYGRMYERMQREWCERCIHELERLQRMRADDGSKIAQHEQAQEEQA